MRIIQSIIALSCGGVGASVFEFTHIACDPGVAAEFKTRMPVSFANGMKGWSDAERAMRAFIQAQEDEECKEALKRYTRE